MLVQLLCLIFRGCLLIVYCSGNALCLYFAEQNIETTQIDVDAANENHVK